MIYILEFSQALGSSRHEARYYIGWAKSKQGVLDRFHEHCTGHGAAITRAAIQRGIGLKIVCSFPGTRRDERRLKNQKNTPRLVRRLQKQGFCQ